MTEDVLSGYRTIPGPWYSYSVLRKSYLWARYMPLFKVQMAWSFLRYYWLWHTKAKHYAVDPDMAPDRADPSGEGIWVPPAVMWELTLCQDPKELHRYYILERVDA